MTPATVAATATAQWVPAQLGDNVTMKHMSPPSPSATPGGNVADVVDEGLPGFGERLLAVIDEGRRISTYKLAVLLPLIDVCAEQPAPTAKRR